MPVTPTIQGREYWLSLEQLTNSPEFEARMQDEFQHYDPDLISSMSRRKFMKLMAGSMALAGLTLSGCRRYPEEKIAPFSRQPDGRIPGKTIPYATSYEIGGVSQGVLATSYDGRPIKIEGNALHPFSLGATDSIAQASVLELYDPERSRMVIKRAVGRAGDEITKSTWEAFGEFSAKEMSSLKAAQGEGLAILSEATSSINNAAAKAKLLAAYPKAQWFEYEPISGDNIGEGAKLAFGKALRPQLHLAKAKIIASFNSDLFGQHPAKLKHARDWATGRKTADEGEMNRLYVAESRYSVTGGVADERMGIRPSRVEPVLTAIAAKLGVTGVVAPAAPVNGSGRGISEPNERENRFVDLLVADLKREGGNSVIVVGHMHAPAVHALAFRINAKLGAIGNTITFTQPQSEPRESHLASIQALTALLNDGSKVSTLVILGGNPVYDAPADLKFGEAIKRAKKTIHLSLYANETSQLCEWSLPRAHYLESWGDGRAWDGTISITQPLILPLYDGKTIAEVLAFLADGKWTDGYELIRGAMASVLPKDQFEKAWRRSLHDGVVQGSAAAPVPVTTLSGKPQDSEFPSLLGRGRGGSIKLPNVAHLSAVDPTLPQPLPEREGSTNLATSSNSAAATNSEIDARPTSLELVFFASELHDGRFANNGWLQELPDPMTKLTWDNAALISKADADAHSIRTGDLITIAVGIQKLDIVAYIMPGQPRGVIALSLGYGRTSAGHIGIGVGFNTYTLRTTKGLDHATGATIKNTGNRYALAMTQDHHIIDTVGFKGREQRVGEKGESGTIIKEASLAEFKKNKSFATKDEHGNIHLQLFDPPQWAASEDGHAWGMAIDMGSCIGCNACTIACQAENNIPIVGKDQVLVNREMHWLRLDRYFKGSIEDEEPQIVHQPMMCSHCENAPCEQVCPVAATVHDTEGLNTMVYNRCIGTRYCSNNCPYKVRRFNYFDFHAKDPRGSNYPAPWLDMPDTQQRESIDPIKQMVYNPDVTVRMRGVMEKCTYCTQRIQGAKIARSIKGEEIQDGDVVTACQSVCPTQAITFGDLNDKNSKVRRAHDNNRAYSVLGELNTRPRTKYLAKVRNPAE